MNTKIETITVTVFASAAFAAFVPARADAFQVETSVTNGCHERITAAASKSIGWPDGAVAPQPDEEFERVMDALPFSIPTALRNPWATAILVGVRYNDMHEYAPTQVGRLVHIHNDPEDQPAHCIRMETHDDAPGDAAALTECKRYILDRIELALGKGQQIDMSATVDVEVFVDFRGQVELPFNRYAFYMGGALHALQDSYTHALRAPFDGRVRHVLNWIDFAKSSNYDPAHDGFEHMTALDDCTADHEFMQMRVQRAIYASAKLLDAVSDPTGGREGRLARAEAVLDDVFQIEPGCTYDNDYCDAPELAEGAGGCSVTGSAGFDGTAVAILAVVAMFVGAGRRRRAAVAAVAVAAVIALSAADSRADTTAGLRAHSLLRPERSAFSGYVSVSAAVDRAAAAGTVGLRYNPSDWIGLGLDLEYNPWLSITSGRVSPGVFNAYGTVIFRHKKVGDWEFRTTANLGTSVMLFDTVGVDKYSTGVYLGASLLGVTVPVTDSTRLVIDPASVSIPAPLVTGFPFFYKQYRSTVGLEIDI